jgi:mannose-6-phosphate isomerase-like protein (cupin superfamily)
MTAAREYPMRKKTINIFKEGKKTWGSYDDFPLAAVGVDPAPHLSRNSVAQPFHLVTARDELLVTMAGTGTVEFRTPSGVKTLDFEAGTVTYLPARMPSRVLPDTEALQVRLKAAAPVTEAAAFFCTSCNALLHSVEFVADVPQQNYWDAVVAFNDSPEQRTCTRCGVVADPVDLSEVAWNDVADVLKA